MTATTVVVLIIFIMPTVLLSKIPEALKRCHINEANLDNCLKTTIQDALQLIGTSGIASINLPPIEPIEVTKMDIGAGTSAVNMVQKYKDIKIYGMSKSTVENAHLDLDKKILIFTLNTPEIVNKNKYDFNGKLLTLPLHGVGDAVITFFGVNSTHTIHFKEEIKNNKKYFKLITYKVQMSMKKIHYDLDNLFDGNKELSDNILKVANENWPVLYQDTQEGIENAYAEVLKSIATRLFHNVPIDEIFLP